MNLPNILSNSIVYTRINFYLLNYGVRKNLINKQIQGIWSLSKRFIFSCLKFYTILAIKYFNKCTGHDQL